MNNAKDDMKLDTGTLTVRAAALELGVSASLVYALCAAGRIGHERHGLGRGTIRIRPEALDEYRRAAASHDRPVVVLRHITRR